MESTATTNHVGDDSNDTTSPQASLSLTRLPCSNENITRINGEFYQAAVEGNFYRFIGLDNIDTLLTPNKNTILHIHLTSTITKTIQSVSQPFVRQIQGKFRDLINKNVEIAVVSKPFVERIIDKCGGLVLFPNSKGETPLHLTARYGHSTITELLIERAKTLPHDEIESGIEGDKKLTRATTKESEDTALHEAVRHNHIEVVEILLRMDPGLSNIANKAKETPLYLSVERQYKSIMQKILELVESPSYEGPNGRTALHAAVIHCDQEMVQDLLRNEHLKAVVRHADRKGWVPLHYAVKFKNKFLTTLLLEEDENTTYMQDNEGRTALHIAAYCGDGDIMEMILRRCPDCSELVDKKGQNALHYAVNGSCPHEVARIMQNLSLSNLYNEKDKDGNTPLHHLAYSRIPNKELVIHHRVDKLVLNNNDQTPLDVANTIAEDEDATRAILKEWLIKDLKAARAIGSQRLDAKLKGGRERSRLIFTKEAKESHLIVATLIATVTFAAVFTLPGGTEQDGGHMGRPIMGHRACFKAFIVSNTIALVMASSAAFIHLFSPLNKPKWLDCYFSEVAFSLIVVAVMTMIIAFGTGTYVMLGPSAIGIAVIAIGLLFFLVFSQMLEMGFGVNSPSIFIVNLVNATLFPFVRVYPFKRSDQAEQRII